MHFGGGGASRTYKSLQGGGDPRINEIEHTQFMNGPLCDLSLKCNAKSPRLFHKICIYNDLMTACISSEHFIQYQLFA